MKKISLFVCCLLVCNAVFTQATVLTPKEESAFKVLKACQFFENSGPFPYYLDIHKYDFERNQNGVLTLKNNKNPGVNDIQLGDRFDYYKIKLKDNGKGEIEFYDDCVKVRWIEIIKWDGDQVKNTNSRGFVDGEWSYDEKGQIEGLDEGMKYDEYRKKHQNWNSKITLQYNENGQLFSFEKYVKYYKKASFSKKLKEDYAIKEKVVSVEYGVSEIKLITDIYKKVGKKIELFNQTIKTLTQTPFSTLNKTKSQYFKNGEKTVTAYDSFLRKFDKKLRLVESSSDKKDSSWKHIYKYNEKDQVTEESTKFFGASSNVLNKEVRISYVYDTQGLLKEYKKVTDQIGKERETEITSIIYLPIEEGKKVTRCEHKTDYLSKFYDENGELFKEQISTGFREKENGVWGEWKHFQY